MHSGESCTLSICRSFAFNAKKHRKTVEIHQLQRNNRSQHNNENEENNITIIRLLYSKNTLFEDPLLKTQKVDIYIYKYTQEY